MTDRDLTSGAGFLREAAQRYFQSRFGNPAMYVNRELHKGLAWTPALRFVIHEQVNVFVEPSESSPYPTIFELKSREVREFPVPIAIYAVCPEEAVSRPGGPKEVKRLEADGFGLLAVDASGRARLVVAAIPIIQIIPRPEVEKELKELTPKMRQRISEAFDDYCTKPVNGVRSLSEIVEGLVEQAGREAVKKQYLNGADIGGPVASTLDAMYEKPQFRNVRAQIGGVRSYIAEYRNLSHHWPKDAKRAHKKYADCRHAFLDGIKQVQRFRNAMKNVGLSGNIPKT